MAANRRHQHSPKLPRKAHNVALRGGRLGAAPVGQQFGVPKDRVETGQGRTGKQSRGTTTTGRRKSSRSTAHVVHNQ